VLAGAQAVGGQDPDLDEVREVGELIGGGQLLDGVRRQRFLVAAGDLQQRGRADGAFEVDMQLDQRAVHRASLRQRRPAPGYQPQRSNSPTLAPLTKASHSAAVKYRTG